jgi:transcriptional regulator with XRE-family HTH domain
MIPIRSEFATQEFSKRLRRFRIKGNCPLEDMAAHLGLGEDALIAIENGAQPLDAELLMEACQYLNITVFDFFCQEL